MNPAACKVFKHWPELKAEHERVACHPLLSIFKHDGTCLLSRTRITAQTADETGAAIEAELDAWRHLRRSFQQALLNQLERVGLAVEYDTYIQGYEETSEKGCAILGDGSRLEADLVVAADGIGTKSGQLILGHRLRAQSSGSAVYRCAYSVKVIEADPKLVEHFSLKECEGGASEMWIG